jgi:hypothetical protein
VRPFIGKQANADKRQFIHTKIRDEWMV